jgi:large subunit ribosomal protein L1
MGRRKSKRFREIAKTVDTTRTYSILEAIENLKKCRPAGFNETVEMSFKVGVDPRNSQQQVRGTVSLPNGTGKTSIVLVLAQGDKVKEALDAGADYAGNEEYFQKIRSGWMDFTAIIATPDMMRELGKLAKILGPRGLMPTPKAGTVTNEVAKAVQEIKRGKVEFKLDRNGLVNNAVGKISFATEALYDNMKTFISALLRAKPATAKGTYLKSLVISSTMGPGIKIDARELVTV